MGQGSEIDGEEVSTTHLRIRLFDWDGLFELHYRTYTDMDIFRGRHLSYQRGKRNTTPGTSLIQIEGVNNTEAAK